MSLDIIPIRETVWSKGNHYPNDPRNMPIIKNVNMELILISLVGRIN